MNIFSAIGDLFNNVICYPLGTILHFCYKLTGGTSYAVALILFTVITRIALFPLALKQQRSSAEMVRMKPKMDKLQKKYAKDKEKLNAEMMKLYQEEGYNPMSGCLPLLIQLPIIYGLFNVVYHPLKYMLWMNQTDISKTEKILHNIMVTLSTDKKGFGGKDELYAAQAMNGHMNMLSFLPHSLKPINFNIFGVNLSAQPKWEWSLLVLIPILSYVTSVFSTWLNMHMNKAAQPINNKANNLMMILLMPLMSLYFAFTFPASVGFYWVITNLFMVVQTLILMKFFSPVKLAKQAEERAIQRKEAIASGKAKGGRLARITQQVMEQQALQAQSQSTEQQDEETDGQNKADESADSAKQQAEAKAPPRKQYEDGKKSRSQLKEENRKKLAESRAKEAAKKKSDEE